MGAVRAVLVVLLLCAAPFGLGALILWWVERKKRATRPWSLDAFGFLVRELGFAEPLVHFVSREIHETYSKGAVEVDLFWDGAPTPVMGIRVGDRSATTWHLDLPAAAELLRTHPTILQGDFSAIERLQGQPRPFNSE